MRVRWKRSYGQESVLVIPDSAFEEMDEKEKMEEVNEWLKDETDADFIIISIDGKYL